MLYFFKNTATGEFTLGENIKDATPAGYYERVFETLNGVEVMSLIHIIDARKSKYKLPLSEFKKSDGSAYSSFDELISSTQGFFFRIGVSEVETPYTGGVVEIKARTANQTQATTGTTRAMPGTYATLTAAYTAATLNDVVQVADGTYQLSAESGGYFLANTTAKGITIRGNASNSSAVVFNHTGASYGIRLRDCAAMTFENITFTSNGSLAMFVQEQAYASRWVKFKNCAFIYTGSSAVGLFHRTSLTSDVNTIWVEFDGCSFTSSGTASPIQYTASGVNETMLLTNCTITTTGLSGVTCTHQYDSGHKGLFAMYDCTLTSSNNVKILRVGDDEAVPTNSTFKADIRNCIFQYTGSYSEHAVLLGRGSNKVYFVNNTVTIPSTSSSLAIGIAIKTAATSVNDSYIAGNYVVAPRPIYIKGAQNNILKFNTGITNYPSLYFGFEVTNPDAGRISTGNVVRFNNFYGGLAAIATYDSTGYEDPETTIKGWTMNNNRYYSTLGESNWMNISSVNKAFYLARTIFQNNNDCYSKFVSSPAVIISKQQIYDPTSTISW